MKETVVNGEKKRENWKSSYFIPIAEIFRRSRKKYFVTSYTPLIHKLVVN